MEELMAKIEANDTRMKYLEKRDLEFTNLKSAVSQIQSDINKQAQNILLNEIELIGIPESPAENLQHTFQLATKKLGVELDEKDVDWITRVGPRRSAVPPSLTELQNRMPRPIVVRLLRRSKRDEILKASKSRRNIKSNDLDAPGTPQNIYFNERLTKENRILFRDARNRAKKEGYAYCWCNRGAIYVRRREGNAAVQLRSQSDLDRLFANTKTTV
ncbi:uncharacterized protein LOC114252347 [Bombyx mandarina]|uniref:Uncharacterized protein LOC114252347 n=1 Tax=Bombyx mandarina TaxID=7092 RepID=A0A6J2KR75_BOMMA|nr:uncharacterized protein LOC114252347 [Bombyx mandarina]